MTAKVKVTFTSHEPNEHAKLSRKIAHLLLVFGRINNVCNGNDVMYMCKVDLLEDVSKISNLHIKNSISQKIK